jgi:hypothetical protein
MGHLLSQREAARVWGVGRASLQRAIASGKLSLTSDKRVDPAEMVRVFGEPKRSGEPAQGHAVGPDESTPNPPAPIPAQVARMAGLEAENSALRELLAAKDAHIEDLRGQVRLLTHDAAPKRRWWRFR